jgi:hypothetical protein
MVNRGAAKASAFSTSKMRKLTQLSQEHVISHESDHHWTNHFSVSSFGRAIFELYIFDGSCSKVLGNWIFKTIESP